MFFRRKSKTEKRIGKTAAALYQAYQDEAVYDDFRLFRPFYDNTFASFEAIRAAADDIQCQVVMAAIVATRKAKEEHYGIPRAARGIIEKMVKRSLPWTEADLLDWWDWMTAGRLDLYSGQSTYFIKAAEDFTKTQPLPDSLREKLRLTRERLSENNAQNSSLRRQLQRIAVLLGEELPTQYDIDLRSPFAKKLNDDVQALPPELQEQVTLLIIHATTARSSKPSAKWLKESDRLSEPLSSELLVSMMRTWFSLFDRENFEPVNEWSKSLWYLSDINTDLLRGLLWIASRHHNDDLIRDIGPLAMAGQRKNAGDGPRAAKVTNAAVWTLSQIDNQLAIGQLAILKTRIRNKSTLKQIDKALSSVAERLQVSPGEVEELAAPDYGLTEVGRLTKKLGAFCAELHITDTSSVELRWQKEDGSYQKSVPKLVKDEFPEELKELKTTSKDIQKILPSQKERLDSLYLSRRKWSLHDWEARYLNHNLVGALARRLIWCFHTAGTTRTALWRQDRFEDKDGTLLPHAEIEHAEVSLWHPIDSDVAEIVAWRERLDELSITQPFKQAHREIYLLTDAERQTQVYSNRFAAHIIKQHQFNALCGVRNWKNSLRLLVDDEYPPANRDLESWNLRAEFWVEGIGDEFGVATNDTGTFYYLATDQVRFYPSGASFTRSHGYGGGYRTVAQDAEELHQPVPLVDVPALVFSEIMRDVDLFVGVASVGNDPNWMDGGEDMPHTDYWSAFAFGDLSATATTRKEILERLIPRLKIGKSCSFDDRFLVVEGSFRTYKIHLGSGNILMAPDDQYLCIVPKAASLASASNKVFLPFEGDRTLAIILSKAFLLADDKKIKDTSILSQIQRNTVN